MQDGEITVVNHYRIQSGRPAFLAAVTALACRVEAEGHPGVPGYRFFCPDGTNDARAVVRYRDAEAWLGHHDLVMGWPEMTALRSVADLDEINLFGPITDPMREWFGRMGLAGKVRHHGETLAGFRR